MFCGFVGGLFTEKIKTLFYYQYHILYPEVMSLPYRWDLAGISVWEGSVARLNCLLLVLSELKPWQLFSNAWTTGPNHAWLMSNIRNVVPMWWQQTTQNFIIHLPPWFNNRLWQFRKKWQSIFFKVQLNRKQNQNWHFQKKIGPC